MNKKPKKKAAKKKPARNKKGQFLPGNQEGTKFTEGNKAAEKWTEEFVLETLKKMWDFITEGHEDMNGNFVRANDIKTVAEVCLMNDVSKQRWSDWKEKFAENPDVLELIQKIEWIVETRMVYSGGPMDMFVLSNHYGYKNRFQQEVSGKDGGPIETVNKTQIDVTKLSDQALNELIAATTESIPK